MDLGTFEITILKPKLPEANLLLPYLVTIDETQIYSNWGPLVRKLESRYASLLGAKENRLVVLANATLAIQGLATILDVTSFKVPDFTFAATGHAVLNSGKSLELVDVEKLTWQMAPPKGKTGSQSGFMPVMPFGAQVPIQLWSSVPNVIFDAAASIGAKLPDFSSLNQTSAVVYSLHATKVGGCGEGAVVLCGSDSLASKLRQWANFGFDRDRISLRIGTNCKMSEYQAAVGNAVLDSLELEISEWQYSNQVAKKFSAEFGFASVTDSYEGVSPYWIAQFKNKTIRDRVALHLNSKSIQCRNWWTTPLSNMPAFRNFLPEAVNSNSLNACETSLGLPMYRGLQAETIERIATEISHAM